MLDKEAVVLVKGKVLGQSSFDVSNSYVGQSSCSGGRENYWTKQLQYSKVHFKGKQIQSHRLDKELVELLYKCFQDWQKKSRKREQAQDVEDRLVFVHQKDWEGILDSWMTKEWKRLSVSGTVNRKKVHGEIEIEPFESAHKKAKGKDEWCDGWAERLARRNQEKIKDKHAQEFENVDGDKFYLSLSYFLRDIFRKNSHVSTVGHDIAYSITWKNLKKMMTDKYCLMGEIKKLEVEMWNLKVKGIDVVSYNQRFQKLALMCVRMFPEESDKIEKYVSGLPDMIHESVMASKPKTMQDALEFTTDGHKDQHSCVVIAYIAGPGERKEYTGTLPLYNKCKFHHNVQFTIKSSNYKRVGHLTRDFRSPAATNNQRNPTCYECKNQGHYRSDCPELKNQNHRNQAGDTRARGMVHALGGGETNQDLNNIKDDINA
nr:hypothetical protein [Tanacetum cinerariifolium]